ncbi:MAG: putative enzyme related to lactoylglutathione lyase [Arenicella sp.]|jgi:predicted enzyme related to lactoylglutathione lyase
MSKHESIDYLEYPAHDLLSSKRFFEAVFDWTFTDYGAGYSAFEAKGLQGGGGFYKAALASKSDQGAALAVFYSDDLASTQAKIEAAGGNIVKPIFSFPGGRRFHFEEPSGNQFAVWTHE